MYDLVNLTMVTFFPSIKNPKIPYGNENVKPYGNDQFGKKRKD